MDVKDWLGEDNTLGVDIWHRKYQYENETFDQWLDRISNGNKKLQQLILDKKFLFGGRILANRGLHDKGRKISMSNCYVMTPPEDNIESIFECAKELARTYSYGGGCGVDISKLAPRGAKIHNAAKETSGAVSFMDLYSETTGIIGQNGRRGALMITLDCHHPDLEEFIDIKTDLNRVTKANISIRITDDFMQAVLDDTDFELSFIREDSGEEIKKTVNARKIFRRIAENNWNYAEPGVLFWDKVTSWNLLSEDESFQLAGTNPCGEEPLPAGGSCLLGALNLSEFVKYPFTDCAEFSYGDFRQAIYTAVDALNEVLDEGLPLHPLKQQRDTVRDWRQIGLGIMGLADMLIKMGITYGSDEAIELCDSIGYVLSNSAMYESYILSIKSEPYPKYNRCAIKDSEYFKHNIQGTESYIEGLLDTGLRNSQLLTIAPTGTISTMLGVSGGIEPIFATSYDRKTESLFGEEKHYKVYTPIVKYYIEHYGLSDEKDLPSYFVTSHNISYRSRIDMQAIWQQHIDASISSTINVPSEFTVENVVDLYIYAWKCGLKGCTIYRDNCKRSGILSTKDTKKKDVDSSPRTELATEHKLRRGEIIHVHDNIIGKKRRLVTGCGTLHCIALFDPNSGDLVEVYLSKGSEGGCNNFMIGLSRMISISARGGISIYDIVDQLDSTGACPSYAVRRATHKDTSKGSCCPMAVGKALLDMYKEVQRDLYDKKDHSEDELIDARIFEKDVDTSNLCPECGDPLVFEGGCNTCKNCGWSRCS